MTLDIEVELFASSPTQTSVSKTLLHRKNLPIDVGDRVRDSLFLPRKCAISCCLMCSIVKSLGLVTTHSGTLQSVFL